MSDRQPEDEGSDRRDSGSEEPINDPLTTNASAPRTPFEPANTDD